MADNQYEKTSRNTVKRLPKRGHYDKDTIFSILDQQFLCHVAWVEDGAPCMIATAFGRKDETLYLHGSSKSRMLGAIADGRSVCITVTQLNGLVLARSSFHHSMNYQSVVIFGTGRLVEDRDEKMQALQIISDQILQGRWDEARLPNEIEMKATAVVAIEIEEASAKVRTGPPADDAEDYTLPVWAGILPMEQKYGHPIPDPVLPEIIPIPDSVIRKLQSPTD